ncbi:MAG: hypothetical protein JO202_00110 [Ktedonobacteraceae bacterium]|nr:hypothetical protein [Ktedonobacteraceae bacterium]
MGLQTVHMGIASSLLVAVLACIVLRPRGLNVAWPASVAALIAIALGLLPLTTLRTILNDTWDASATLIALFLLSEALDAHGFFTWAALYLARSARGSGWLLYILILVLTLATTGLLANDGAVLILIPIFATLLVKIYKAEAFRLPFLFAAGFLADAASTLFVPSNLTNIIIADANRLNFTAFAQWMALPTLFAAATASCCFGVRFHRLLGKKYDTQVLEQPHAALQDRLLFWVSWGALLLLVIGYIIGSQFHLPISYIAGPIALSMVLLVQVRQIRSVRSLLLAAPWSILFYALAMFVVITAAYYAHVLSFLTVPLRAFVAPSADVAGAILSGSILALLSAAANNLPATLIGVLVLHMVPHPNLLAIYAMILGVDVGPKFTPFGSLATLLWLDILRRNGIRISWLRYFYENWWITLVTLGMSFVGLVVSYALFK